MSYLQTNSLSASSMVSILSREASTVLASVANTSIATGAWPGANRAIYVPIVLSNSVILYNFWTANGSSASDTRDIGIYNSSMVKIISTGSTAGSGTSALQVYSVTPTEIGPGIFYIALVSSGTTSQFLRESIGANGMFITSMGIYQQATAFPLPSTATFASATSPYVPIFGFSTVPIV